MKACIVLTIVLVAVLASANGSEKAGVCPEFPERPQLLYLCAPQCTDDGQCDGAQKCCMEGCGLKCVDPAA